MYEITGISPASTNTKGKSNTNSDEGSSSCLGAVVELLDIEPIIQGRTAGKVYPGFPFIKGDK